MKLLTMVAVLLLAAASHLAAQEAAVLAPGTRVRITVPTIYRQQWLVGTVQPSDSGTIALRREPSTESDQLVVPLEAIDRIQISRGVVTAGERSAITAKGGAVAGMISGMILGALYESPSKLKNVAGGACLFGLAGAGLGSMFGAKAGEIWEPTTKFGLRVGLGMGLYGTSVGISVAGR